MTSCFCEEKAGLHMRQGVSYFLISGLALMVGTAPARAEPMPSAAAMPIASVTAENVDPPAPAKEDTKADAAADTAATNAPSSEEKASDEKAADKQVAQPKQAGLIILPSRRPGETPDDDDVPIVDTDETTPLPPYPPHARVSEGKAETYAMGEEDTLQDVARFYNLGFVELRAANPKVDPWTPVPGEDVLIPSFHLLPRAPQIGIVVNLAQMRMFYFKTPGADPITFPIGIGREGLLTPTGETSIVRKVVGPTWFPTPRMREEKPYLPAAIGPGPSNPLGAFALYLGWPEYRIHGTDKPWAIGRRVSSGCMRMYPENIKALFAMVPVGTKVTVVDQPILVGWIKDKLYLEANPSKSQNIDIEINGEHQIKPLTDGLRKVITDAAGVSADKIDWDAVKEAIDERRGYPVVISGEDDEDKAAKKKEAKKDDAPPPPAPPHALFKSSAVTRYDYNR
jgi:L,D-transpeptidase ErfK/SrfK